MESKYLSDGRKVCVIGKINTSEHIVQEIFITKTGDEIPSGEKFTTKSLHDAPVESYKQRRENELDKMVAAAEKELEMVTNELSDARGRLKTNLAIASSALKSTGCIEDEGKLNLLSLFMSGSVKYIVCDSCGVSSPIKFEEALKGEEFDNGIKLITLFGKSNGDLEFRINRYSDGCGGYQTITPFSNKKDALLHIKARFMKSFMGGRGYSSEYAKCVDMGISFTKAETSKLKKYFLEKKSKQIFEAVESHEKQIDKINELYGFIE